MKKLLVIVAASGFLAGPTMAADLPVKAPPLAPVATSSWAGCYLGLNAGFVRNASTYTLSPSGAFAGNPLNPLRTDSGDFTGTAGTVGGTLGCNLQSGNLVYGLEGDLNWSGIRDSDTVDRALVAPLAGRLVHTVTHDVKWFGTLRGRLGWVVNNLLIYGTGGLALASVSSTSNVLFTLGSDRYAGSTSTTRVGWTLGAGGEYALGPKWSLKAEYLYVDLGSFSYLDPNVPPPAFPTFSYTTDGKTRFHVARLGLNLKFSGMPLASR